MSAFSAWYTAPCVHDIYIQLCLGERVKAHPHSVLLSRHAMVPLIFRWSSSLRRSRVPSGHLQSTSTPIPLSIWGKNYGKRQKDSAIARSPSLNQEEEELRLSPSLTEIGFPFRAIYYRRR